jgi:hypothetical protein
MVGVPDLLVDWRVWLLFALLSEFQLNLLLSTVTLSFMVMGEIELIQE